MPLNPMWNEPSEEDLAKLPKLYETEHIPLEDKVLQMHFFIMGSDWYAVEYSPEERLFFGYVVLNYDKRNAEWGYFSLDDLCSVRNKDGLQIDRDLFWKPKLFRDAGIS